MSRYSIEAPTLDDIPRLAAIQQAAFDRVEDPLTRGALLALTDEEIVTWNIAQLTNSTAPRGYKEDFRLARDQDTGEIAGWAKWWIPTTGTEPAIFTTIGTQQPKEVVIPSAVQQSIWSSFFIELDQAEKDVMGDRKHWSLSILVVDPAWQRRGVGKALLQDGIHRADSDNLPIFVSGSARGVPLYQSVGFEIKNIRDLTDAKIKGTFLIRESVQRTT